MKIEERIKKLDGRLAAAEAKFVRLKAKRLKKRTKANVGQ